MFNKHETDSNEHPEVAPQTTPSSSRPLTQGSRTVNQILKGTSLTGDVHIDCDLELSGEVEGNITSDGDSSVIIKGVCKGGITTKGGSVRIEGVLKGGDIIAGSDVTIIGSFGGGKVTARGKILIDGEFNGILEANDIELGANARGAGRLIYRESLSIARGAQIEGEMARVPEAKPAEKTTENTTEKTIAKSTAKPEAEGNGTKSQRADVQRTIADAARKSGQKVVAMQGGSHEEDAAKEQTKASQSA